VFTIRVFHNVDASLNVIRVTKLMRMRTKELCTMMREVTKCVQILVGYLEGQSAHRRLRCRWEDSVKMKTLAAGEDCINLTQDGVQR
jgi:hypothetical protein